MKKIGIDARLYSQTGVGTYLKNLLHYLDKDNLENQYYIYLLHEDYDKIDFTNKKIVKRLVKDRWHSLGEQTRFALTLYGDNLDLVHFTYFSYPILYLKKFVATVHDTTPLLFKTGKASTKNPLIYNIKHFFFKLVVRCQVNRARQIIVPTDTVRRQVIEIYGADKAKKTTRIYEGINYQMQDAEENKALAQKYKNFFIYVGNFYPHKNVEELIKAFSSIKAQYKLLLIGPTDFFKKRLVQTIDRLSVGDRIEFIQNPSTNDLIFYYKNAMALIHPSLSEGFGLPTIEAAYFNCPIIASNIAVFKELLGKNYSSFNPNDREEIQSKINEFIKKRPEYDYRKILMKYSFEKMTEETLIIYNKALL